VHPRDEDVRVLVRRQRPQVDAVHPVQLLVVEDGRALGDPLQREPFDQLVAGHDRRAVVVAPAEQREIVDERVRLVALRAELVRGHRPVPLRERRAVRPVDKGDVPVPRHRRA
jgi:hypothetical protein